MTAADAARQNLDAHEEQVTRSKELAERFTRILGVRCTPAEFAYGDEGRVSIPLPAALQMLEVYIGEGWGNPD